MKKTIIAIAISILIMAGCAEPKPAEEDDGRTNDFIWWGEFYSAPFSCNPMHEGEAYRNMTVRKTFLCEESEFVVIAEDNQDCVGE